MGKSSMKKVLLLDTNVSSFPIYNVLVEKGHDVYVIGLNPNDCLAKHTKNYINANYSDIPTLDSIIEKHKFDIIVPGCNDVSYLSATKANIKKFGLDTTETTEIINNKSKFRDFAKKNNLYVPRVFTKNEAYDLKLSLIVKPSDAYSGRGTSVISDTRPENIDAAVDNALKFSPSKACVIEEYVVGQLYSHTSFISDTKILKDFFVIENGSTNEFTVDTSHVVYDFPNKDLQELRYQTEKMARILNLVDGLIHTQFIKTKDSFRILEITRRCPGDLYSLLIEKSTGFKYSEAYTRPFIGMGFDGLSTKSKPSYILRHTISSNLDTPFVGLSFKQGMNIDLFIPLAKTGEPINKSPFGRMGILFTKHNSYKLMAKQRKQFIKRKMYIPVF
jgi:carbamoylphosphate synthase large subunit